ncbi:Alpha/Beta hydrolase protein [Chytriomyces sp. MP71]|nr:Alpha/Beta hydrolase protein [Chytriomyces sp. MP71]
MVVTVSPEESISFSSLNGDVQLRGILSLPRSASSNIPLVILVAGSGEVDRNENSRLAQLNVFNKLAEALAKAGIASLRYDKRGVGESVTTPTGGPCERGLYHKAGVSELMRDVVAAGRFVACSEECKGAGIALDKVFVCGHSDGALMMPLIYREMVADAVCPTPKGCIFLCGFGETLPHAMVFQRNKMADSLEASNGLWGFLLRLLVDPAKLRDESQSRKLFHQMSQSPTLALGLVKNPYNWFREHGELDRDALYVGLTCHILAIGGGKDFQTSPEYCEEGAAAKLVPRAASLKSLVFLNMTHVLRDLEGPMDPLQGRGVYIKQGGQDLKHELTHAIISFILSLP